MAVSPAHVQHCNTIQQSNDLMIDLAKGLQERQSRISRPGEFLGLFSVAIPRPGDPALGFCPESFQQQIYNMAQQMFKDALFLNSSAQNR